LLVLDILKTEKAAFLIVLFPIQNIPDEGHYFFITLERSKTRQDKFESILEIIESVVSSPFVKAEADSVEYFVLCLIHSEKSGICSDGNRKLGFAC
jgi:ribosomal protein S6